ncbi:hypothetical protein CCACVL1_26489 [Corchorus capsularis]|uniref:Uncharacterized protein n=1 Tax=Corchorus capsularis TaxID=210143 RepID=A0A1R3GEL6_COCAP|nr:hypothetical protein CCACVL1_26489 [Corchorus capsularis]
MSRTREPVRNWLIATKKSIDEITEEVRFSSEVIREAKLKRARDELEAEARRSAEAKQVEPLVE